MFYRKKPIVIEAYQFTGKNGDFIIKWTGNEAIGSSSYFRDEPVGDYISLKIFTLEGLMEVNIGDYVIKGVEGEFYPCKESIFLKTYEEVS